MKLIKKQIQFEEDGKTGIVTQKSEVEKFKDRTNKEVTLLDKKKITLQEVGELLIMFLKEQGYEESEV